MKIDRLYRPQVSHTLGALKQGDMSMSHLPKIPSAILLLCLTLASTESLAEQQQESKKEEVPPNYFLIYSESGNESFQVDCSPRDPRIITCEFMGLRFGGPKGAKGNDIARFEAALNKLGPEQRASELEKMKREMLSDRDKEQDIRAFKDKLSSPSIGPKMRQHLESVIAAYSSGDVMAFLRLMHDFENRTCGTFIQHFKLDFERIGPRKWVSNNAPSGLCNILKVYELTGGPRDNLWSMTETRVTAGITKGVFCEGIQEELNKPTTWAWNNPNYFELPCDFISNH